MCACVCVFVCLRESKVKKLDGNQQINALNRNTRIRKQNPEDFNEKRRRKPVKEKTVHLNTTYIKRIERPS